MTLAQFLFKNRSYSPIPFLIVMVYFARPNLTSVIIGLIVAFTGELFRFWGVAYIGSESRTTGTVGGSKLMMNGPFAYTRNPLYVGNIVIYLGIGIISNSLFPYLLIFALVFFIFQYYFIIKEEEKYLLGKFEKVYIDYCKNVRRFIPRVTPYVNNEGSSNLFDFNIGIKSERRTLQGFSITIILILIIWAYQYYVK